MRGPPGRYFFSPKVGVRRFGFTDQEHDASSGIYSSIITSNKNFAHRQEIIGDAVIATIILNRLLRNSKVVNIKGPPHRLKDQTKAKYC